MKKRLLNRECVTGFLTAGFGAFMLAGLNPRFGVFPKAIFIFMVALGLFMLATTLLLPGAKRTPLEGINRYEALFIAIMIACPAAITWLGFYAAAFLVILAVALLPLPDYSPKRITRTVLYVLVITVVTYAVFSGALNIKVPSGLLF